MLLVLASAALAGCGSGGSRTGGSGTSAHDATADVTGAVVGDPVPSGFVGMSIEIKALERYAGSNPAAVDPVFVQLIKDIAPEQSPVLRIGGDSTDWTWWPVAHVARPPGVKYTLTPNWMHVARAARDASRGHLILGVDLEADNRDRGELPRPRRW